MIYMTYMQKAVDYIEDNLKTDLATAELARIAGYSEYHFPRVFKQAVGLTPADYIRKRRISEIVRRMMTESCPISDLAFEYGFHSKENFIRAFKREHCILPTELRSAGNSLRLYDRFDPTATHPAPQVTLALRKPQRIVVYPNIETTPPQCWNRYNTSRCSLLLSGGQVVEDFGISDWNPARQKLDYYIGIREVDARGDRTGTVTITLPEGLYAIFDTPPATQFDFVATIHRTWDHIRTWLPANGFRRTGGYEWECYTESLHTFTERIYIPITKERNDPS